MSPIKRMNRLELPLDDQQTASVACPLELGPERGLRGGGPWGLELGWGTSVELVTQIGTGGFSSVWVGKRTSAAYDPASASATADHTTAGVAPSPAAAAAAPAAASSPSAIPAVAQLPPYVAVKVPFTSGQGSGQGTGQGSGQGSAASKGMTSRWHAELKLAFTLSHPHLVRSYGVVTVGNGPDRGSPALLMELCVGSLAELIRSPKAFEARRAAMEGSTMGGTPSEHSLGEHSLGGDSLGVHSLGGDSLGGHSLGWPALQRRLLVEVSHGLRYLHAQGVLHRDVKAANVLLDTNLHAKLCDFGLARRVNFQLNGFDLTSDVGTNRYMAPEVVFGPYDHRADIYSFGVLVWEVLHGAQMAMQEAHGSLSSIVHLMLIMEGYRPPILLDEHFDEGYAALIADCWSQEPKSRPSSMASVAKRLEQLHVESKVGTTLV